MDPPDQEPPDQRLPGRGGPPGPFRYDFSPNPAGVRVARYVLAAWLERQPGINVDAIDDLLVVCSELCTNAASHCTGGELAVRLEGRIDGDAVVVSVSDDGGGFPFGATPSPAATADAAESGRGLFIVAALTNDMSVATSIDQTTVRVRRTGILRQTAADALGTDEDMSADFRSRHGGTHAPAE